MGEADFKDWFTQCEKVLTKENGHCGNKRATSMSFQEPSPNTSAAVWQGPRGHLKGTTMEKINLASSLQLQR